MEEGLDFLPTPHQITHYTLFPKTGIWLLPSTLPSLPPSKEEEEEGEEVMGEEEEKQEEEEKEKENLTFEDEVLGHG